MAPANEADELTFKGMWDKAQADFERATKRSLKKPLSFNDALSKMAKRFDSNDPKDGEKQGKIKEYATDVINFIQLLGGLAAQGASMVFGPACMCFNAFQAILDIPGKIFKLHDHLALLFGEITTFMKQFRIYERIEQITTLDLEFRTSVHKLMIAFVDISAMCVKFCDRSTLIVFKQMSKLILFDNDSGVSDALENFRRLSKQHADIRDAVTLERVVQAQHEAEGNHRKIWDKLNESAEANTEMFQKIEESLDTLVEDAKERKNREARQKTLESLRKKLGVAENKKLNAFLQLRLQALHGSGDWLESHDSYQTWSALTNSEDPLLLLSGPTGSGRSMLLSIMSHKLENRRPQEQDKQFKFCVANYVFESNEKTSNQSTNSSVQAICSAAMQFAENYTFAKALEAKDISIGRDTTIEQLFETLFSPTEPSDAKDASSKTFYILFLEDINQLSSEEAQRLVRTALQKKASYFKVVISGTEDFIDQYLPARSLTDRAIPRIKIAECNEPDIQMYIEDELKRDKLFQSDTDEMRTIIPNIREKLPGIVHGCFSNVDTIINNIRSALESERDIEHVLDLISEKTLDRTDELCEKTIRELRHTLSAPEIEQLNELLIWTIYGVRYFNVNHMRAVMFLLMSKNMFQDLEVKVNEKFSKLIKIDSDGDFVLSDWNTQDYFRNLPRIEQVDDDDGAPDEPRISMQITIRNAKVSQVQRFCWDLGEMVVLDKLNSFTFAKPLASAEAEKPLGVGNLDGDLTVLHKCFDLLLNEPNVQTQALADYATTYLLWHLPPFQTEEDRHKLTTSEKHEVVTQSLSLLMQNLDTFDTHLTPEFCDRRGLLHESGLLNLKAFLSDPKATAKLRYKQRDWAKRVTTTNIVLALEGVAKLIAHHWLREETWSPESPYAWLASYIDLSKNPPSSGNAEDNSSSSGDGNVEPEIATSNEETVAQPTSGDNGTAPEGSDEDAVKSTESAPDPVLRAAEWSEQNIALSKKDALWYERLGRTYLILSESFVDEDPQVTQMQTCARNAFLSAKTLADHSWFASYGLAQISSRNKQFEDAVTQMDIALSELRLKASRTDREQDHLVDGLMLSAEWQMQLKNADLAVLRYQEVIELTPNSARGRYELFKLFYDTEQKSDALDLLRKLGQQSTPEAESTELCTLCLELCSRGDDSLGCMETIFAATSGCDIFGLVLETLESMQPMLQKDTAESINTIGRQSLAVRLSQSIALAHYASNDDHAELAQAHLRECIRYGFGVNESSVYGDLPLLASRTFLTLYFSQAKMDQISATEDADQISEIKQIMHAACLDGWHGSNVRMMLGGYYRRVNQRREAEKLVSVDVQTAIGLLSDTDPENDAFAYILLGEALIRAEDYLNAVAALGLVGPPERHTPVDQKIEAPQDLAEPAEKATDPQETSCDSVEPAEEDQSGPLSGYYCDGLCEDSKKWTWSSSFWYCRICAGTNFCHDCLAMLRAGTLKRRICSSDHDWLLVPSCKSQLKATGMGNVLVGGTLPPPKGPLQDGHRTGGDIMSIEEWLDTIREKWGIEKKVSVEAITNGATV